MSLLLSMSKANFDFILTVMCVSVFACALESHPHGAMGWSMICDVALLCQILLHFEASHGRIQDLLKGTGFICIKVWGFALLFLSHIS